MKNRYVPSELHQNGHLSSFHCVFQNQLNVCSEISFYTSCGEKKAWKNNKSTTQMVGKLEKWEESGGKGCPGYRHKGGHSKQIFIAHDVYFNPPNIPSL